MFLCKSCHYLCKQTNQLSFIDSIFIVNSLSSFVLQWNACMSHVCISTKHECHVLEYTPVHLQMSWGRSEFDLPSTSSMTIFCLVLLMLMALVVNCPCLIFQDLYCPARSLAAQMILCQVWSWAVLYRMTFILVVLFGHLVSTYHCSHTSLQRPHR